MKKVPLIPVILVLVLFSLSPVFGQENQSPSVAASEVLPAGSPAPAFTVPDLQGRQVDLAKFLGKTPMVLSFWSIYCDSCVEEMLALQKLEDKYKGQGLVILAVNEDIRVPMERIQRFVERLQRFRGKITYPLIFDQESRVLEAYGVTSLPTLILIDGQGRVAGHFRGFDPEGERDLLASIEGLVRGDKGRDAPLQIPLPPRTEVVTVVGEASLCGFFDETGWRKSFTGSDSLKQEMELTRNLAARDATRRAVTEGLRMLGITLFSHRYPIDCVSADGIHLDRDPLDTDDPMSNLLSLVEYGKLFQNLQEQEMLIGTTFHNTREVRVFLDSLKGEMESLGYLFEPIRITFTYVNMSRLDQKEFLRSLLKQDRFIGRYDNLTVTAASTSQVFEVFTSSQNFATEIVQMDFGKLKVFVEEVTPTSLELEVWK